MLKLESHKKQFDMLAEPQDDRLTGSKIPSHIENNLLASLFDTSKKNDPWGMDGMNGMIQKCVWPFWGQVYSNNCFHHGEPNYVKPIKSTQMGSTRPQMDSDSSIIFIYDMHV